MKRFAAALIGVLALGFGGAQQAGAVNLKPLVHAYPVDDEVFEVVSKAGGSGGEYWCGAADYAQRVLHAKWTARIYVVRGRGPSVITGRRSAVQFSLRAPQMAEASGMEGTSLQNFLSFHLLSAMRPGTHMSVQEAMTYCEETRSAM
ncbi:hypothetical protein [Pseudodonghicola xiamenensis]|uniref:Uncharacterized protein n=1 Tax=Pseudodonghicola xiamenensis TaxID=337702 RepID=A0A8J3H5R6_9RHOB|nr:hypothetical protein [Pseudodonghicola xiamenensis]GHG90403.1 hypothetical protein GCM10010961_20680 [Pseudodonghicola xiamenensis]